MTVLPPPVVVGCSQAINARVKAEKTVKIKSFFLRLVNSERLF
jgi:hypothetical protein